MTTQRRPGLVTRLTVGRRYERLAEVDPQLHPVPGFPSSIERLSLEPQSLRPKARPSTNGAHRWCVSCDTVLPGNGKSAFCVECVSERKRIRQQAARDRDRQQVILTAAEVRRIHENVDELTHLLGELTVVYNNRSDRDGTAQSLVDT